MQVSPDRTPHGIAPAHCCWKQELTPAFVTVEITMRSAHSPSR